jgi:acyl-CoA synthetase (NDP forming)
MKSFLQPRSVAVVGASSDPKKGGYAIVSNLKEKFSERLYPVNPGSLEICGLPCFRNVMELPEPVELAIVFVPSESVPGVLEECASKGIRRVMIQSAGFAETGERGLALQNRCKEIAENAKMRLWGPNCMGVVNGCSGMVASFIRTDAWQGRLICGDVSLIVQSGMLAAGFLVQIMQEGYFGVSKACSIGNRCDVNECDLLEYFRDDPDTSVVAMYLESISDAGRFRKAVTALNKPVLLLKGGTTSRGAEAARSHTASLAQDSAVAEGLFRQLGIHRAFDFLELADLTKAVTLWKGKKGGKRIGVVTFSGASATVATDHLIHQGMSVPLLSEKSRAGLAEIFPSWAEVENPVDLWPAIERTGRMSAYRIALEVIMDDPCVDSIFVHAYVDSTILEPLAEALGALQSTEKAAALWVIGDANAIKTLRTRVEAMQIPMYTEIARAVRALGLLTV